MAPRRGRSYWALSEGSRLVSPCTIPIPVSIITQRATKRAMLAVSLRNQIRNEKIRSKTTVASVE